VEQFVEHRHITDVDLRQLQPITTLLVWTQNSCYRVITRNGGSVYLQGGLLFPEPTPAHIDGACIGRSVLRLGWIGVGLRMEIRVENSRVVTSPIREIVVEPDGAPIAH
jgi:hypothetical protein